MYRDKYPDFNVRHFYEKLKKTEGIELSYSWVKQTLQGAGLVAPQKARTASPAQAASTHSLFAAAH